MQLAAEAGNGPAQLALGRMYRTGVGIAADNIKAYVWLNVAAAQGVPGAAAARDTVLPRLSPAELQEAQAQARRMSSLRSTEVGHAPIARRTKMARFRPSPYAGRRAKAARSAR